MSRARINPRMLEAQRGLAGVAPEALRGLRVCLSDTLVKAELGGTRSPPASAGASQSVSIALAYPT